MSAPLDLDAMRARHEPIDDGWAIKVCSASGCNMPWPCDAAQLLALLTEERIAEALRAIWDQADSQEWPQSMCLTCSRPSSRCDCDDDSADIRPAKPLAGTWYVGHRWLLLDDLAAALLAALTETK